MARIEICEGCGNERQIVYRGPPAYCQRCYRREIWRKNPDARERERAGARAYKRAHRAQLAVSNRNYRKRLAGTCPGCGGSTSPTTKGLCASCRSERRRERWEEIQSMWKQGMTIEQIAGHLGVSPNTMGPEITAMRAAGFEMPYRRARAA